MSLNFWAEPTIEYCEKPILSTFVKRPFYALSNVFYLFIGLLILYRGQGSRNSKVFGYLALLIGMLSFFYDATYKYFFQILDLGGMILFVNIIIFLNVQESYAFSKNKIIFSQIIIGIISMLSIVFLKGFFGNIIFSVYVLAAILSEWQIYRTKRREQYLYWTLALAALLVGFIFWLLDASGWSCDPKNIINGRGVFHLLTSISIYLLYVFYEKNNPEKYGTISLKN